MLNINNKHKNKDKLKQHLNHQSIINIIIDLLASFILSYDKTNSEWHPWNSTFLIICFESSENSQDLIDIGRGRQIEDVQNISMNITQRSMPYRAYQKETQHSSPRIIKESIPYKVAQRSIIKIQRTPYSAKIEKYTLAPCTLHTHSLNSVFSQHFLHTVQTQGLF